LVLWNIDVAHGASRTFHKWRAISGKRQGISSDWRQNTVVRNCALIDRIAIIGIPLAILIISMLAKMLIMVMAGNFGVALTWIVVGTTLN
jgi:hypothetical protein